MKLIAFFYLIRIFESLLSAGTMAMALLFLEITNINLIFTFMGMLFFAQIGINCWNDSLDVLEDSVAHPERPIPSGEISIFQARSLGSFFLFISIIIGFTLSLLVLGMILLGIGIGIVYSILAKPVFLLKNTVVSGSVLLFLSILPIGLASTAKTIYYGFVVSLVLLLQGYEILKDLRDVSGDKVANYKTLPIKLGIQISVFLTALLFGISCLIISIFFFSLNLLPEAIISLITVPIIVLPFFWFKDNYSPKNTDLIRYITVSILFISLNSIGYITLTRSGVINGI